MFNTTFKTISVTTFVAEIGVPREIHRPVASHWHTLSQWHIFTSTNNTTTILFPTQLWELLYTYHVIKQCTEKETTSISNFLLTIKLNYLHHLKIMIQCLLRETFWWVVIWIFCNLCLGWVNLYVIIPVHGIGSKKPQEGSQPKHKLQKIHITTHQNVSLQLQYLLLRIMCLFSEK
jgi:hypothetical protein